jgi:hypothetical protein
MIDEVRIWNVRAHANADQREPEQGADRAPRPELVGYWDFNEDLPSQVVLDKTISSLQRPAWDQHRHGFIGSRARGDFVHSGGGGTASIAGTLFNDLDADGVKDSGEGALSNWKLWLDSDKDWRARHGREDGGHRFIGQL